MLISCFSPGGEDLGGEQVEHGVDAKGVRDEHQDCDEQWEQAKDTVDLERVAWEVSKLAHMNS